MVFKFDFTSQVFMEEIVGIVANGRKEETWKISDGDKCTTDLVC